MIWALIFVSNFGDTPAAEGGYVFQTQAACEYVAENWTKGDFLGMETPDAAKVSLIRKLLQDGQIRYVCAELTPAWQDNAMEDIDKMFAP